MLPVPSARRRAPPFLALALLGCGLGCGGPHEAGAGRGCLLVVIDGLRADHVSSLGYDRPTTPVLDQLAADGVSFQFAFAAAPLSVPAHASLVTGSDPFLARRFLPGEFEGHEERNWRVPEGLPHLAAEFLAAGRHTAAFVDDPALDPLFGFGVGFQVYEPPAPGAAAQGAHALVARLGSWLQTLDRGADWFALLHVADLERSWSAPQDGWDEYFPPRDELSEVPPIGNTDAVMFSVPHSRWRGGSHTLGEYEAAYDGHLRHLDEELGELFAVLRRQGRWQDTSVAVVGSFGVEFGEAGLFLRGGRYSLADLHVPWIFRPREERLAHEARGRRIEELASSIDVAPTLLAFEGLAPPVGMLGLSFAPWIEGRAPAGPARSYVFASCGMQEGGAVIGSERCLEVLVPGEIVEGVMRRAWFGEEVPASSARRVRCYDWRRTPFPPLTDGGADAADPACRAMQQAFDLRADRLRKAQHLLQHVPLAGEEVDEAERRELAELGYLGARP